MKIINQSYEFCENVNCIDFDKDNKQCSIVCGCNKKTKEFYIWLKAKTKETETTQIRSINSENNQSKL